MMFGKESVSWQLRSKPFDRQWPLHSWAGFSTFTTRSGQESFLQSRTIKYQKKWLNRIIEWFLRIENGKKNGFSKIHVPAAGKVRRERRRRGRWHAASRVHHVLRAGPLLHSRRPWLLVPDRHPHQWPAQLLQPRREWERGCWSCSAARATPSPSPRPRSKPLSGRGAYHTRTPAYSSRWTGSARADWGAILAVRPFTTHCTEERNKRASRTRRFPDEAVWCDTRTVQATQSGTTPCFSQHSPCFFCADKCLFLLIHLSLVVPITRGGGGGNVSFYWIFSCTRSCG